MITGTAALRLEGEGGGARGKEVCTGRGPNHTKRASWAPAGKLHRLASSSGSSKLARHLASVLIKVGNQFGGYGEENGSEILMAAEWH